MFGDVVRAHRHRLGLSQEELADKAGVNARTIGNLESGRIAAPRPATVRLLADAFGLRGVDRDRFCAEAVPSVGPSEPPVAGAIVPRQLPAVTRYFAGRLDELELLDAMEPGGAVVISAISGTAGIGKTALALHWAHRNAHRFPDGQLYVNLRGFDASGAHLSAAEALRGFLEALEVPARRIPASLDAQAALFRSVMADRWMLVVLDNARDADHVRPLLPASPGCLVVVTSRNRLTGLVAAEAARVVTLGLLSTDEAMELLGQRLGRQRLEAEPEAARKIVGYCARLPLALSIVAARASAHPGFPLASLAAELRDARGRLDALRGDDTGTDARAVFSWSYAALDPSAARLFRLLGQHPGLDVTAAAAASLAGMTRAEVLPLLAELTRVHLLAEHVPGRFVAHDLLRVYAADLAARQESKGERTAAQRRLRDHYLHTARAADRWLNPFRDLALDPPVPGVEPEGFAGIPDAMGWFTAEYETLQALIEDGSDWRMAWVISSFLYRRSFWDELARMQRMVLSAAQRLGHTREEGLARGSLGRALLGLGRLDEALHELECGLAIVAAAGDLDAEANLHRALANVWESKADDERTLHHIRRSFELSEASGDGRGQAAGLNNLGLLHLRRGEYPEALAACRRALALHEQLGWPDGQAAAWDNLGNVHHLLGEHAEAIACYHSALRLLRELTDQRHEAVVLVHLGEAHESAGDRAAAEEAWREALSILEPTRSPEAAAVRARLHQ